MTTPIRENIFPYPMYETARMMPCDNESGAMTNHRQNERGEWVCEICGHNMNQAQIEALKLADAIGFIAQAVGKLPNQARGHWFDILVEVIGITCGDEGRQQLINALGGYKF